ncbi:MAG: sulfotransferase family 2 domain-containing protein [Reichenbachiella sp.]|uniref:sulfotransferase family 2 domain-containing protein n=1 Tax=Reichenbachiella sp. TaxID=2184521 RepID=UPI0032985822
MIIHENKMIFLHIPKNAGTSIEKYLRPDFGLEWDVPNYDLLYGWCPDRQIHLQHATPQEMIDLNLIDRQTWDEYTKFAVIRNPWERAVSDFIWLKEKSKIKGNFMDYLLVRGDFSSLLTDRSHIRFKGDHIFPQIDFLKLDGEMAVKNIINFENLDHDLNNFFGSLSLPRFDIKLNQNTSYTKHYSNWYTNHSINIIKEKYASDIVLGNYHFDDQRSGLKKIYNAIVK